MWLHKNVLHTARDLAWHGRRESPSKPEVSLNVLFFLPRNLSQTQKPASPISHGKGRVPQGGSGNGVSPQNRFAPQVPTLAWGPSGACRGQQSLRVKPGPPDHSAAQFPSALPLLQHSC